jgi:hypothetical protein
LTPTLVLLFYDVILYVLLYLLNIIEFYYPMATMMIRFVTAIPVTTITITTTMTATMTRMRIM